MLRSVIFDLDGTLVNLESLHYKAHAHTLLQYGVTLTLALHRAYVAGRSNRAMLSHFFDDWDDEQIQQYGSEKEAYYRSLVGEVEPTLGVRAVLDWAVEQELVIALVTNATRENVDFLLQRLNLFDYFSLVILGEELARTKPDPLPYKVALHKLNCAADEAIVFEDSEAGIQASRAAGIFTVGITTSLAADTVLSHGADLAVADFQDSRIWSYLYENT